MKHEMYKENIKKEYLKRWENNKDSYKTYSNYFYRTRELEESFGKDLSELEIEELKKVLFAMGSDNANGARTNGNFISRYITWAIQKLGLNKNNPLKGKSLQWYSQFVDKNKKIYISENEVLGFINKDILKNAQDAVILILAFNGLTGYQSSEIRNLREEDIDWEKGILRLNDDRYGKRNLKLMDNLKEITLRTLRQALDQKEYINKNGEAVRKNLISPLVENDYVIKTVKRRSKSNERAKIDVIYRRMSIMSEVLDLPGIDIIDLRKSGEIKMAKDLFLEFGKLDKEQFNKIGDHFAFRKVQMSGNGYYNFSSMKEYINLENLINL